MDSMLLLLAAACCLAGPAADAASDHGGGTAGTDGGMWRAKQEYVFNVDGRCLSHLPSLNRQVAGFQTRGRLLLQAANTNHLFFKLENMTYAKTHTVVASSWWDNLPDAADDDAYRELPISKETVEIKLDSGLIQSVVVSDEVEDWEVNMLQGVSGSLQADLAGTHAVKLPDEPTNDIHGRGDYLDAPIYSVFEDSVSGRCEVTYEVGSLSQRNLMANPLWSARRDLCPAGGGLFEVVKSRNHSNCERVAESHFGLKPALRCTPADSNCGNFWTRSSVTRLVGCGDRKDFLLLSASTSSQVVVNLHLHNGTEASASCYLRLSLLDTRPISEHLPPPKKQYSREITGLSYQFRGKKLDSEPVKWAESPEVMVANVADEAPSLEDEGDFPELEVPEATATEAPTPKSTVPQTESTPPEILPLEPTAAETTTEYNWADEVFPFETQEIASEEVTERTSMTEPTTTRRPRHKKKPKSRRKNRRKHLQLDEEVEGNTEEQFEGQHHRSARDARVQPIRRGFYTPLPRPLSPYYVSHRAGDAHACMVQQLKELVTDIGSDLELGATVAERRTLEKLAVAVEMCRALTLPDLQRALAGIMDVRARDNSQLLTERKVYRDVVKLCGTSPAFHLVRTLLEAQKLRGAEAAELLSALPASFLAPDAALVQSFYELARSRVVQEDEQLKVSAVLAFSQLLRVACVDEAARRARFPPDALKAPCTPAMAARYLPWLNARARLDPALRAVYLAALGNTGSFVALPALKAAALNSSYPAQVRAVAILSMRHVALRRPAAVAQLLLVVFRDYGQPLPVRLAAGSLLLFTRPGPALWHRLAIATWFEPSPAVVTFVWTTLRSLAVAEDPTIREMSEWARGMLRLAKPAGVGPRLPYITVWTEAAAAMRQLVLQQISYLPAVDGANLYYRRTTRLGGLSTNELEVDAWTTDPALLLELLSQYVFPAAESQQARPPVKAVPHPTSLIREVLHIAARQLPSLQGSLRFNIGGLRDRIFLFDSNVVASIDKVVQNLMEEMKSGKELHYQSAQQDELVLATVNDLGFPVSFQLKSLMLARANAKTKLNAALHELSADASALVTWQLLSELGVYTGWDDVLYLAASHATSLLRLPPSKLRARLADDTLQLSSEPLVAPADPQLLFYHSSTPFTAQHDILSLAPASLGKYARPDVDTPERSSMSLGELRVDYKSRERPASLSSWLLNSGPVFGFPLLWNTLEPATVKATLTRSHECILSFSVDSAQVANGAYEIRRLAPRETQTTLSPQATTSSSTNSGSTPPPPSAPSEEAASTSTTTQTSTEETATTPTTIITSTPASNSTPTTLPAEASESVITELASTVTTESTSTSTTESAPSSETTAATTVLSEQHVDYLTVTHREAPSEPSSFNATDLDPFSEAINGSSLLYLLDKAFSGIDYGRAVAVAVNASVRAYGESSASGYNAVATLARALDARLVRAGLFLNSEQDSWQISATGSWEVGPLPLLDVDRLLASNVSSSITADFVYQANETRYIVLAKGSVGRSEQRTRKLQAALEGGCPTAHDVTASRQAAAACVQVAHAAALANKYDFSFSFNDQVVEFLEASPDQTEARARLELDEERGLLEGWLRMPPQREAVYHSFMLGPVARQLLLNNAASSLFDGVYTSTYCGVSGQLFHTFDGLEFEYELGSDWHLLAKDCSGRSRVAVLARRQTPDNLEVEVNADNYRVATLGAGPRASVNGLPLELASGAAADVRDDAGVLLMRLSAGSDGALAIAMPGHGFVLRYGNATLLISASMGTRGRLCGICGNNDGESVGELINPRGNTEKSPRSFAASYKLK